MAHSLRHLIRSAVERVAPNALEPVEGNRFRLRAACPLVLFALVSPLLAQTPRAPEQLFRFTVFSAQPIAGLGYTPRAGAAATKVQFYPTARSPRYEYRGAMPLKFTDAASGSVVAEAVVPTDIHDALLLVAAIESPAGAPKVEGALKYRVAVLNDGAASHAPGRLVIINFSGLALSGTVDGKAVTLDDGLNPAQNVGRSAKVVLKTTLKGRTYQSYTEDVRLKANERALLILFPPFYKGSLEVQSRLLVDEPPPPPAPRAR